MLTREAFERQAAWPQERVHGWAPGSYSCTCGDCGIHYVGAKRSVQCYPCAAKFVPPPRPETIEEIRSDRDALRAELDLVRGAIRADDERLYAAWVRIHGAPDDCANIGCDALEWMTDEILRLRAELDRTKGELAKGWISTSDHLPEDGQNVAFITKCDRDPFSHGRVLGGRFTAGEFGGFSVPGLMTEASHWLALPPIPAALERKADA